MRATRRQGRLEVAKLDNLLCCSQITQMIDDRQELGIAGIPHGLQRKQAYTNVAR